MNDANVLNRFKQPGPDGDNELLIGGTMTVDGTLNFQGSINFTGNLLVPGDLAVSGTATFDTSTGKFVSLAGNTDLATQVVTVEMPNITTSGSEVSVYPNLAGRLIDITLIMQGPTESGNATLLTFQKFTTPAGDTEITTMTVPAETAQDQVFSSSPIGALADFTTATAVRVKTNNAGTGTSTRAVIVFTFLID